MTGYATAGLLSKAVLLWLNPLLKLGQSHPLEPVDIPLLAPDERSLSVYTQLRSKWLQQDEPRSLLRALVHTFWLPFTFLGVIALVKSVVMYAGPSLIQQFTDFTAGIRSYKYEGYVLVGVLLLAKVVEVLCSHQFLFLGQKLGILIRTSLVATVYRKGLCLSSAGRQTHGVGNIVSYMSTDVQQIGDSIYLLHNVWVLPLQILIAMGLLFRALGLAAIAGFGVMVLIVSCNLFVVRKQRFSFSQVSTKHPNCCLGTLGSSLVLCCCLLGVSFPAAERKIGFCFQMVFRVLGCELFVNCSLGKEIINAYLL